MIVNYLRQQETYVEKYGDRTIVLMQIGSFYEMYEFNPEKCEEIYDWPKERIGSVIEIASLLNMVMTRKDKKKPYILTNCDMIGFPVISYEKHRDVLLGSDYTIVRIDQKKNLKDEIERFVAEILSPATNLENIANLPVSNNIMSIYIEILKKSFNKEDYVIACGLSSIDVTTGQNSVLEIYSQEKNAISALQEIYRYLSIIQPRELILTLQLDSSEYGEFLNGVLNLDKVPNYILKTSIEKDFSKIEYQTKFLSKLFSSNKTSNSNIIEDLSLERIGYGRISYIVLLQHCYEHNVHCIEKLNKPNTSWLDQEKYLILTHNAISQLNLLPDKNIKTGKHNRSNKNIDSLFSVINHTKTALGKRYLMNMLTCPITDVEKLNESYESIDYCLNNKSFTKEISGLLTSIPDIERYQRKLYLKIIKPHELAILFQGYLKIVAIYTRIYNESQNCKLFSLLFDSSDFSSCLSKVLTKFNLDLLSKSRIDSGKLVYLSGDLTSEKESEDDDTNEEEKDEEDKTLIYSGVDSKFDRYCEEMKNAKEKLNGIINNLNSHLEKTKGKKIVYNGDGKKDRNLGLWTTPHKANVLKESKMQGLSFINVNKEVMITSNEIASTCKRLVELKDEIAKYLYLSYMTTIEEISTYTFFSTLSNFISKVDFIVSGSIAASENKYFKPKISGESSFFSIKNMRHPVVECLIPNNYICNDLSLQNGGLLLYGQNSSGKSTFGKAIALNIILAQAGLFTAGELEYYPYSKIITRLSGNDSVLEGLSSFVIEMKELRTILRNADSSSLIIADEIARGTESVSAISLTVSAVNYLLEKKSSFIFSTHLHSLVDMSDIKTWTEKQRLKVAHLALKYDEKQNVLIYDRKLREGPGDSVYGLEVAQSLNLDSEFISRAYSVRKEIMRENVLLVNNKKSKYNGKVYLDTCAVCGCTDIKKLQTHHILEQHTADTNGFINSTHKNIPGNLVEICDTCHESLHHNKLSLTPLSTSSGISLKIVS